MEHLKVAFHAELADPESGQVLVADGKVVIGNRRWAPGDLLQALGGQIFDDVFANWLAERQQRMLDRADEILSQYDQTDRFETLKAAFQRGTVLPFIGAGMSMPSQYPGWTAFLRKLRRQTSVPEARLNELLARDEYEQAAQELADALDVGFDEQVESTFGRERELRGPVQLLPLVFPTASAATTNFDDVLPRCFARCGRSFDQVVSGVDADEMQRVLGTGRRVLVKLHGTATSGRGRVLTSREYEAAYGGDALTRVVRVLCGRTLLFMGCRLTVDRLLGELRRLVATEGHQRVARHYALLATGEDEAERPARAAALARLNVYPIWYPEGTDDESIEALLYRLANGVVSL